ncbi:MAG TPA: GNAT family N-acetyltransferase [Solirubrobacterales bacterium]|nr:GNAT family N-acetyltransferase [Solirubrobacterales bacterium]
MTGESPAVELIADRGEAASSAEFFRSLPFLEAEGATHTLRIVTPGGAELLAPLIVRPIGGGPELDAISPYGYPGLTSPARGRSSSRYAGTTATSTGGAGIDLGELALDPGLVDFAPTGLVSIFLRHRLGPVPLTGASRRNVVQIADPALPPKSRPSDRRQARRNLDAGYEVTLVPGPETTPSQRAGFLGVYEQTMRRAAAAKHYFFAAAYFDRVLEAERTWLALATAPGGELAAASLVAASDGFLHYYLSGSADSHLRDSPMKNVVARLVEHSADLGLPLNLGGGISPGDALEEFKRGFANRQEPWHTSEIISDQAKYQQLSAGHARGAFFPAYRA